MADSMEAFWGRLGAFADPVNQLADASCGCALNADLGADGSATIDATEAMSRVVSQYVALSKQGETLRQMMSVGVKIPCDVWSAYANARLDYMRKSQYLFDQLTAKDITVDQVVYSGGKPKVDPNDPSKVVTLQVQAPLRPPAFVGIDQQCPGVPVMAGASFAGALGWERTPISLGSVSSSTLVALGTAAGTGVLMLMSAGMPLGLAGYGAYKTVKKVAAIWQDYDASPSRILTAYTGCFQAAVSAGMTAADAAKSCSAVQTSAQAAAIERTKAQNPPDSGLGFWGWLGVGAGVFIVLSIGVRYLRGRMAGVASAARMIAPVGDALDFGRPRARRKRRAGSATNPILIGDLYLHPRGRQ